MAKTTAEGAPDGTHGDQKPLTFNAQGEDRIDLPSSDFISNAQMMRDGDDLILETPNGETAVIEGYFAASPAPLLQSPDGSVLTPNLVDAFSRSPQEYAGNETVSDQSPVGAIEELKGNATVTRADGTVETITIGTPIYEGDIIETDASGAVNIVFIDETSMAVSENARLAIDAYSFDPSTESGTTNFSVLRGLFVFTSGLIGRDDPDDVHIDTPVGSIGIRGTIIAGEINPGGDSNITVLEGAIVVKNGLGETTLSVQFETVKIGGFDQPMESMGVVAAADISSRFSSVGDVVPTLFTTINDTVREQAPVQQSQPQNDAAPQESSSPNQPQQETAPQTQQPAAPPMMDTIINLNSDSSGLPSTSTITGNNGSSTDTAMNDAPSVGIAPQTVGPASLAPPSSSGANTTETPLTPPSIISPPATGTAAAPSLVISAVIETVKDTDNIGTTVANLSSTGSVGVTYTFAGTNTTVSADGYFELFNNAGNAEIVLTTAGANKLSSSLDTVQLGNISVIATGTDGKTATQTFNLPILDSNDTMSLSLDSASRPDVVHIRDNLSNGVGYTVTALGDVNQDGFDDFAFSNNTASGNNHIHRVLGSGSMFPDTTIPLGNTIVNPTNPANTSMTVVRGIGDFNGDGINDYILGQAENQYSGGGTGTGSAVVVDGSTGAAIRMFSGALSNGTQVGYDVDGVGDFNNDGYADVIIGAPGFNSGNGTAFFVQGAAAGTNISTTSNLVGTPTASNFGTSVTGIGDINGDGYSDFAVGAPTDGTNNEGSVSIYLGNQSGVPSAPQNIMLNNAGERFGNHIAGLGDINGDGNSDFLVGTDSGNKGYIFLDGNYSAGVTLDIPAYNTSTQEGYDIIGGGGVGDFNGDGFDDFALTLANNNGSSSFVVFGKENLPGTTINLDYLKDGNNAFEMTYAGARFSDEVEINAIGDVNGDGYDDMALGVPDLNGATTGNGGVILVYGRDAQGNALGGSNTATATGQNIVGGLANDQMYDGGYADVSMRGGAGSDMFHIQNTNFQRIDGGSQITSGYDAIVANAGLNFTALNFEKISGIEQLRYGGNQTVTLSLENIFNLLKSSDTGDFKIDTISGGTLNITDAGFSQSNAGFTDMENALQSVAPNAVHAGGSTHNAFNIGGHTLYIDADLAVNISN